METLFSPSVWLTALIIFVLRVANMSLDTLRVMVVVRGQKLLSWVLGFLQTVIFIIVLNSVLQDLNNILNVVAYAAGFATGNVLGMWIEERLAIGHLDLRIISSKHGPEVADRLREEGYAVTEVEGRGRDGAVAVLRVSVKRKNSKQVHEIVQKVDPEAFITAEDLRPVRRGFWRA